MRMFIFLGIVVGLCWSAELASAQNYRDTSGDAINPEKAINNSPNNAHIQLGQTYYGPYLSYRAGSYAPGVVVAPNMNAPTATRQAAAANTQAAPRTSGDQWRFRHYNGQWWYCQTNNQWLVWNGTRWTEPMANAGSTHGQNNSH